MRIKPFAIDQKLVLFCIFAFFGLSLFDFQLTFILKNSLTYILLFFWAISFLLEKNPSHRIAQFVGAHTKALIVIFSCVLVLTLFGKNIQAEWGPIDDHEIMSYLGVDQKLPLQDIPQVLMQTEAGKPGTSLRYRPVYEAFRLLEISAWGNNPHPWYITRLVILVAGISILWMLITPVVGFIPGGLLMVYLLSYQMWADMFARLGPSETYTVLALAVYAWGYAEIIKTSLQKKKLSIVSVLAWVVGTVICVGAKENYVLLLAPNLLLAGYVFFSKKSTALFSVGFIATTVWTLFVGTAFVLAVLGTGTDVYGASVETTSRLGVLVLGAKHIQSKIFLLSGIITAGFTFLQFISAKRSKTVFQATLLFLCVTIVCEAVFLSQFVFYNADWPNHSRYDFPGVLVIPVFYTSILLYVKKILKEYKVDAQIISGLQYGALLGLICITIMRGFVAIQVIVERNVQVTQSYSAQIEKISQVLKQHPEKSVLVVSGNPWDYEPVYAYGKFLRAYGVINKMYLQLRGYSPASFSDGIEKRLATELQTQQLRGGGEYLPLPIGMQNCYSILLTDVVTPCEQLNK